jgi:neural Wiskott-Aldrich syndrome protein
MVTDPNRKTLRHFYCADGIWQMFEQMSEAMDRGVDELVNEAMRAYAEKHGYLAGPDTEAQPSGLYSPESRPPSVPPPLPSARATAHYSGRPPLPLAAPVSVPPAGSGSSSAPAPPLYLIFGNQKYMVDKDQFIIGRGAKSSDLPIRDGNISRKHAAVVRRGGAYYIKDLGSTNGIDFNGERIEARKIEEGDVYSICDYQLRFTFK